MPDPEPTPENSIKSLAELHQIIAALFEANGVAMEDIMNSHEVLYMDPRSTPESEWIDYSTVPIPEHVKRYLDSHDEITRDETNAIEEALEKFYQISTPWFITLHSRCSRLDESVTPPRVKITKPLQFLLVREPD